MIMTTRTIVDRRLDLCQCDIECHEMAHKDSCSNIVYIECDLGEQHDRECGSDDGWGGELLCERIDCSREKECESPVYTTLNWRWDGELMCRVKCSAHPSKWREFVIESDHIDYCAVTKRGRAVDWFAKPRV